MNGFILGEKSTQSQTFASNGERIPTTFIKTESCHISYIKTSQKNGYASVQLGFKQVKKINKAQQGILDKAGIKTPLRFLREFRIRTDKGAVEPSNGSFTLGDKTFKTGQEVKANDMFAVGDIVAVSGTSKGKGFQGVVKRHAFKGGSKTHGQSDRQRAPGSIGMTTTPGRVFKGKRMAGRMGNERITVQGLQVIEVSPKGILVKGVVPGTVTGLLEVRKN
jgi:large subunit ribosomal protein L3